MKTYEMRYTRAAAWKAVTESEFNDALSKAYPVPSMRRRAKKLLTAGQVPIGELPGGTKVMFRVLGPDAPDGLGKVVDADALRRLSDILSAPREGTA